MDGGGPEWDSVVRSQTGRSQYDLHQDIVLKQNGGRVCVCWGSDGG